MPVTIPLEVYEEFEKGLGKEGAKKVVKGLESVISEATEYKWKATKDEILDAMKKESVTRELFVERMGLHNEKINALRVELDGKIENVRVGLEGKIENFRVALEGKIENFRVALEEKIENVRIGLDGKIELVKADIKRLDMKLNFLIVLMIIALTLMNPVMAEIIKNLLKL